MTLTLEKTGSAAGSGWTDPDLGPSAGDAQYTPRHALADVETLPEPRRALLSPGPDTGSEPARATQPDEPRRAHHGALRALLARVQHAESAPAPRYGVDH